MNSAHFSFFYVMVFTGGSQFKLSWVYIGFKLNGSNLCVTTYRVEAHVKETFMYFF